MTWQGSGLVIDPALFATLMTELGRRGRGTRESGAFLLGNASSAPATRASTSRVVTAVAFYDDLDPACLTGGITFHAHGYTALAALCRRHGLQVIGDIHTHPGCRVDQSPADAAHPMVALPGHIALIAPRYAKEPVNVSDLGAHVFQGAGRWTSYSGSDVCRVLQVTKAPGAAGLTGTLRRRARDLGRRLRRMLVPERSR
jgi:proteasome lid subunit RPN8/RPN11